MTGAHQKAKVSNKETCGSVVLLLGSPLQLLPSYVRWPTSCGSGSTYGKDQWTGRRRESAPEMGLSVGCSSPEAAWIALICMESRKIILAIGRKTPFQRVPGNDYKRASLPDWGIWTMCKLSGLF